MKCRMCEVHHPSVKVRCICDTHQGPQPAHLCDSCWRGIVDAFGGRAAA